VNKFSLNFPTNDNGSRVAIIKIFSIPQLFILNFAHSELFAQKSDNKTAVKMNVAMEEERIINSVELRTTKILMTKAILRCISLANLVKLRRRIKNSLDLFFGMAKMNFYQEIVMIVE
jgi:hypothetical protein